jgi:hypothetical protein
MMDKLRLEEIRRGTWYGAESVPGFNLRDIVPELLVEIDRARLAEACWAEAYRRDCDYSSNDTIDTLKADLEQERTDRRYWANEGAHVALERDALRTKLKQATQDRDALIELLNKANAGIRSELGAAKALSDAHLKNNQELIAETFSLRADVKLAHRKWKEAEAREASLRALLTEIGYPAKNLQVVISAKTRLDKPAEEEPLTCRGCYGDYYTQEIDDGFCSDTCMKQFDKEYGGEAEEEEEE